MGGVNASDSHHGDSEYSSKDFHPFMCPDARLPHSDCALSTVNLSQYERDWMSPKIALARGDDPREVIH